MHIGSHNKVNLEEKKRMVAIILPKFLLAKDSFEPNYCVEGCPFSNYRVPEVETLIPDTL